MLRKSKRKQVRQVIFYTSKQNKIDGATSQCDSFFKKKQMLCPQSDPNKCAKISSDDNGKNKMETEKDVEFSIISILNC